MSLIRTIAKHESEVPVMKRIGVLGGFGQWATLDILERLFRCAVTVVPQYGNRGYPSIDVRFVNRAPMLLNPDGSFPEVLTASPELLDAAKHLGTTADFIILPSNTPHIFHKEIEEVSQKPLLSMIDITVQEIQRKRMKRVGVIAIGVTLKKRLYQDKLKMEGIDSIVLPEQMSRELDEQSVWAFQEGADAQDVRDPAIRAVEWMRKQNVESIVLGCTELPIILDEIVVSNDIMNPSQLLAEVALKMACSV